MGPRKPKEQIQAAEEPLSKERAEWKKVCEKDNQRMYVARSKITDLETQIATLKGKVEEVEADKGRVELNAQVASKDKDLAAKDAEIAELKLQLYEAHDKNESLEIDLEAERVKAATAEEAKQKADEGRDISPSALYVAQNNYAEAQSIVDMLVSKSEWMCNRGVVAIANSILNATEMDEAVVALIDASRAVGHRGGYLECAQHVEEAFGQQFDTHHCSVTDKADFVLSRAEEVYDHLSLPVMELVTEALKHDDWCTRLRSIIDPPKTVELSDQEEAAGGDGDGDGDGDGYK
ncbi:putative intermediate filament, rod domain, coil 1B [Helianthus anomalus]